MFGQTHYSKLVSGTNILFTCEHATGRIPEELGTLGLGENDLKNCKDLYDLGALALMQKLAEQFGASYLYADISRLVVDPNRLIDAPNKNNNKHYTSLVKTELLTIRDGKEIKLPIPHNEKITEGDERTLYDTVCVPYQKELVRMVDELKKSHSHVFVFSIHSFFPIYNGQIRTVDIDVIRSIRPEVAPIIADAIRVSHSEYVTAIDEPWSAQSVDGGVFYVLQETPDITGVFFDIKNDNLANDAGVAKCTDALGSGIRALIAEN